MSYEKVSSQSAGHENEPATTVSTRVPIRPRISGRNVRARITKGLLAVTLFLVAFLATTDAWKLKLYEPILYWGDALEMASHHGRDYVSNDLRARFFAPFGVENPSRLRYVSNLLFQPNAALWLVAYLLTGDTIASINLYYLLTFPLAFISAYWVYGRLKLPNPFRFGAATLFALMPYHFLRNLGHLMESSYFLVPVLAYIVLSVFKARPFFHSYRDGAWRWSWGERQDWLFLGVMVFLSQINEYHQFFFLMLMGVSALITSIRRRSYRVLAGAAIILSATALSTATKLIVNHFVAEPELVFSLIGTPISSYGDAEIYGLKIVQVILPVGYHHLESFRAFRGIYDAAHVVNENGSVSLGLFGAVGFVVLIVRALYGIIAKRRASRILDLCALLTLCCVLIATVGGGGSVIATAGRILFGPESILTQIRGYNRIVVFIGFFSYYAGSILLAWLAFRVAAPLRERVQRQAVVLIVWLPFFALALWDQLPFQVTNSPDGTVRHASDKKFFSQLETELPPRSMIFQYPLNIHHVDVNGSRLPYNYSDGIRPYLNSRTLRFTYGADNGSAQIKWLEEMSSLPPEHMVKRLCQYGFSGILVHRRLFKEPVKDSAEFEARLSAVLGSSLQESAAQDFSFAPLNDYCARQQLPRLDLTAERVRLSGDGGLNVPREPGYEATLAEGIDFRIPGYPNFLAQVSGMAERESSGRWGVGPRTTFAFKEKLPERFKLIFVADTLWPNQNKPIMVKVGDVVREFTIRGTSQTYMLNFEGHGDQTTIEFVVPKPVVPKEVGINSDTRPLSIWFVSMKIEQW